MPDVENVIKGLKYLHDVKRWSPNESEESITARRNITGDALALLKAQEQRHRLEVHNIGNVDIPENVTEKQFHAVMNNVVAALEHTDKGESWPYDEEGR